MTSQSTPITGFAIDRGEVVFINAAGGTIRHGGAPVGVLLDASSGFLSAGKVEDLRHKRLFQIAGARHAAPALASDMERDLVILAVEPTEVSICRANMALHHQYVAQQIAANLRDGKMPELAAPLAA
jgi:hypothetical protein